MPLRIGQEIQALLREHTHQLSHVRLELRYAPTAPSTVARAAGKRHQRGCYACANQGQRRNPRSRKFSSGISFWPA